MRREYLVNLDIILQEEQQLDGPGQQHALLAAAAVNFDPDHSLALDTTITDGIADRPESAVSRFQKDQLSLLNSSIAIN